MRSLGYQVSSPNLEVAFSQPLLTPHPCPRALASASSLSHLTTSGSAPQGARFYASAPGQPTWDKSWVGGGGACRFPWREGVARGGSRCPACPDLLLGLCAPDPRGGRGWGLEVVTRLRPESPGHQVGIRPSPALGLPRRSQKTCPQARGWRERRRPNSAPLRGGAHTLALPSSALPVQPSNFSPSRPGGQPLPYFAQAAAMAQLQLLTPRRWGKGNPV